LVRVADHQPFGQGGLVEAGICRDKDEGRKFGGGQLVVEDGCRSQMDSISPPQRIFFKKRACGLQQRNSNGSYPVSPLLDDDFGQRGADTELARQRLLFLGG